jgi:hypothetical protein
LTPDLNLDAHQQRKPRAIPRDVEAFLKHWQGIAKTGLVPTLQDFLTARPFKHQSDVAIADVLGPTEMRIRLFGTGLSTLAGNDLTGRDVFSNFHPDAHANASMMGWNAVNIPCGYYVLRELRRGAFETKAVGIGLPLLNEKTGKYSVVCFSSVADKLTDVIRGDESPFVRSCELLNWIDIGAGTPNG